MYNGGAQIENVSLYVRPIIFIMQVLFINKQILFVVISSISN